MKLLFIDVETGGLKPKEHPLLEIGMRCETNEDDQNASEFSVIIRQTPAMWSLCTENALKVNQFTFEEVNTNGVPITLAAMKVTNWLKENQLRLESTIVIGQNIQFDLDFLMHYMDYAFEEAGLYPIDHAIDIMDLARQLKQLDRSFQPVSLSGANIALALGLIPEDVVHRAMGGVHAARANYYALKKRLTQAMEVV